jgi:hypothetical protein
VAITGVNTPLTGQMVLDADPLPKFSATDRAARQVILLRVYDWTKSLANARSAARALIEQSSAFKTDVAQADSLNARITRVATELDRVFAAMNGQRGPIEGWSGLPSVDQRKSLGYAIEDAGKAVATLNRLTATDIPAAYRAANKSWSKKVGSVAIPVAPASSPRGGTP